MKIAFFDTKPYDRKSFNLVFSNSKCQIKYFEPKLTQDTVSLTEGFDAICTFVNDNLNSVVIKKLVDYGVKLIVLRCAGYNNIDLKEAYGKIHVLHVPSYSPNAVAEHAIALIMTLNRKTHKAFNRTRDNNFSIIGLTGMDMHGKTAGIIGTGKIGQIMISILKGFGMNILAYDNFPKTELASALGFTYVTKNELYNQSHIISLHCPLTPETHHLINKESIKQMKQGIMIINTGRGGLIKTVDLIDGLKSGEIGYAGLDVYEEEGEFFFEDLSETGIDDDILARLLSFPNVLVTSHQAFLTNEALQNIAETTLENVNSFIEGNFLDNEVCYRCTDKLKCPRKIKGHCSE